jgi:hypothetical protein
MHTTATASPDLDLMSRHQVAVMFRVTSARVAQWARRGRLHEVRDETGRPRYRRTDVEDLFSGGRPGNLCGGPDHPDWPLPPRR